MSSKREVSDLQFSNISLWYIPAIVLVLRIWTSISGQLVVSYFITPLAYIIVASSLIPVIRARTTNYRSVIFLASGIFVFGCSEAVWVILDRVFHLDPVLILPLSYLYVVPNLCFAFAFIIYSLINLHLWHPIQFAVDLIAVSIINIKFIFILFFDASFFGHIELDPLNFSMYLNIALDTIVITMLVTIYISSRSTKVDFCSKLIAIAMVMYSTADFLYVHQVLNNTYAPNGLIDLIYIGALLLLATGVKISYLRFKPEQIVKSELKLINEGPIWAAWWILIMPTLSIVLHGIHLQDLLEYALIIIAYLIASLYIQNNIVNERLLSERTVNNEKLLARIDERTKALQSINEELTFITQHDALTGLYNRNHFLDLVDKSIALNGPNHPMFLILVDIDRFKMINDLYGQDLGDVVLKRTAERLNGFCNGLSYSARLGSDEFAILCYGNMDLNQIQPKLNQLFTLFEEPIDIFPFQILVNIRIGLACYPENARDTLGLLKCVKTAVEQAKSKKLKTYSIYDKKVHEQVRRRHEVELALLKADMDVEFTLFYQSQYDATGQILFGMEALIRWDSPILGRVNPAEFISVAEDTGLILNLGIWVMATAMRQIVEWNTKNDSNLRMGINISPLQLENSNFMESVMALIHETGVKTDWLNFEITESSAMAALDVFGTVLTALSELGIAVSIDDFGTGYSSYSYLRRFSIDYLKIDKQLVDMITTISDDAQIVHAIIAMAKVLKIKTVAEGVETIDQVLLLNQMGCDKIQGYYFGKPIPAVEFEIQHIGAKSSILARK